MVLTLTLDKNPFFLKVENGDQGDAACKHPSEECCIPTLQTLTTSNHTCSWNLHACNMEMLSSGPTRLEPSFSEQSPGYMEDARVGLDWPLKVPSHPNRFDSVTSWVTNICSLLLSSTQWACLQVQLQVPIWSLAGFCHVSGIKLQSKAMMKATGSMWSLLQLFSAVSCIYWISIHDIKRSLI